VDCPGQWPSVNSSPNWSVYIPLLLVYFKLWRAKGGKLNFWT
jgi:hypothetical protein